MKTRRDALLSLAAATSLPVLGQHQHTESSTGDSPQATPRYFSSRDFRTVTALVDLIIPRSETPGASDARVHFYIDSALRDNETLREGFRTGLAWLDGEARRKQAGVFADLSVERQTAILRKASEEPASPPGRFFKILKDLTIDGYYSSKEGLTEELGWHGNTFLADFTGCTHPEHQG